MDSIYKRYVPSITPKTDNIKSAYVFAFDSNKVLVKLSGDIISIAKYNDFSEVDIEFINEQYLGELDGQPCYCMEVNDNANTPDGIAFRDLRSLLGLIDEDIFLLAGRAFQIMSWNKMNKYCGRCGNITETKKNERSKICPKCNSVFYPRISPAIIVAITKGDEILLAHNKNFVQKRYSVIAGFVEPGETFEDCVRREVKEEVGISVKNIKYFDSQPWPFPDSLMVGFTAEWESSEIQVDGIEIDDAAWFKKENIPQTPTKVSIAGRLIEWFINKK